jgi:hypothetical protein
MKLNQKGKAKLKVITKCLEEVKIYGIKPIKLLKQINKNNENKIRVCPELATGPTRILNSEWS